MAGHHHDHAHHAAGVFAPRLRLALALVVAFLVIQVAVAFATGSLALLSDAGHLTTDALGLAMALTAITLAERGTADRRRTFGWYRLEILAALANAALLIAVAAWVLVEAIGRIGDAPEIDGAVVLVVGVLGLVVNLVGFALLRAGSRESINVEGAYLEVLADLMGSAAVVVGAALIWATGWRWVDPALGVLIAVAIVPRAVTLGRRALRILTQAAPDDLDPDAITADLSAIDGVVDVHDLHVWTLTSGMEVATAHVMVAVGTDHHRVLDAARDLLADRHGITHATLQVEPSDHEGCTDQSW